MDKVSIPTELTDKGISTLRFYLSDNVIVAFSKTSNQGTHSGRIVENWVRGSVPISDQVQKRLLHALAYCEAFVDNHNPEMRQGWTHERWFCATHPGFSQSPALLLMYDKFDEFVACAEEKVLQLTSY